MYYHYYVNSVGKEIGENKQKSTTKNILGNFCIKNTNSKQRRTEQRRLSLLVGRHENLRAVQDKSS